MANGDEDELAPRATRKALWLGYVIGAFGLGINHQVNFLLPLRARELGASFEVIGLIVAAGPLIPAFMSVPLGALIDRLGPKRCFVLSTSFCVVLATAFAAATNYWTLLLIQLAYGPSRGLGWVASQAYITGLGSSVGMAGRAGRFSFFGSVGPMIGPLSVGAVAQVVGFRFGFLFVAFYAAVFLCFGLGLSPAAQAQNRETRPDGPGIGFGVALRLLMLPRMQAPLALSFVRLWIEGIWVVFYPVYLAEQGVRAVVLGTVLFVRGLVATLVTPTVGLLARRWRELDIAAVSLFTGTVGVALSPLLVGVPQAYLASFLVGLAGLCLPLLLSMVTKAAPAGQRGVALGLRGSINHGAAVGAPALAGPLIATLGITVAFPLGGLAGAFIIGGALLIGRKDHE